MGRSLVESIKESMITEYWYLGALVTLVPLYQSEIAPPAIRGLLVGTHGVVIVIGYITASWIGFGFYFVNASGAQWRIPLAVQCIPPLALVSGVMFVPESPRWCQCLPGVRFLLCAKSLIRYNSDSTRSHRRSLHRVCIDTRRIHRS